MEYNEFVRFAKSHILEYLPEEYEDATVKVERIYKPNTKYDGMTVRLPDELATPIINLQMFYELLEGGLAIDSIMRKMAEVVTMTTLDDIDFYSLEDYEAIKSKLFIRLSPRECAEDIMADGPYREIGDMLLTYHILLSTDDDGVMTGRFTNRLLQSYFVTADELHQDALENTPRILKPEILPLATAITGVSDDTASVLVVTTENSLFGASILFCDDVMEKVAAKLNGNYYAIPSSIHEFIVIREDDSVCIRKLEQMILEANQSVVEPEDLLSNRLYHYDAKDKLFETALDYERRTICLEK